MNVHNNFRALNRMRKCCVSTLSGNHKSLGAKNDVYLKNTGDWLRQIAKIKAIIWRFFIATYSAHCHFLALYNFTVLTLRSCHHFLRKARHLTTYQDEFGDHACTNGIPKCVSIDPHFQWQRMVHFCESL